MNEPRWRLCKRSERRDATASSSCGTATGRARKSSSGGCSTSLRGFIDQVDAKVLAAKIVAIAAYLRDVEGKDEFSQEEIGGRFKGAGELRPRISRNFRTAVGQGWIAEDHQKPGQYFITKEGDAALASKFEGIRGSTGRKARRRKKTANKDGAGADGRE